MYFTQTPKELVDLAQANGTTLNDDQAERLLTAFNSLAKPMIVLPTYDEAAAEAGVSKREIRAIAPIMERLAAQVNVITLPTTTVLPLPIEAGADLAGDMAALFGQAAALMGVLASKSVDAVRSANEDGDRRLAEAVDGLSRDRAGLEQRALKAEAEVARLRSANAALEKDKRRLTDKVERLAADLTASKGKVTLLQEILADRGRATHPTLIVAPDIAGGDADAFSPDASDSPISSEPDIRIAQPAGVRDSRIVISEMPQLCRDDDSAVAQEGDGEEAGDEDVEELLADIPG